MEQNGKSRLINQKISAPRQRGQTLIEFVIILPALLLVLYGIIEFGRLLYTYSAVVTASREAARYGTATGPGMGNVQQYLDVPGMTAAARRSAPSIDMTLTVQYDKGAGTTRQNTYNALLPLASGERPRVVVTVSATFTPLVPLVKIPVITLAFDTARTIMSDLSVGGS